MIVDLGLHVCSDIAAQTLTPASLEEQEAQRRVYWAAYCKLQQV
jgi:hypothetical protein